MTRSASILAALALATDAAELPLSNGDRIVLLGDSIIFNGGQTNYGDILHASLALYRPDVDFKFVSVARSGLGLAALFDDSPSTYQVYSRWVYSFEPDYVIFGFADNGGYDKATEYAHVNTLIDDYIVGVSGATPVLLGMVPQSDIDGYYRGGDYDDNHQTIAEAATPNWLYHRTWDALSPIWIESQVMTADSSTDTITGTAHGFSDGDRVIFQNGTPPGGLTAETYYYVRDATANTFKVAATSGGSAIDITSNGTGPTYWSTNWAKLRGSSAADEVHPSNAGSIIAAYTIWNGLGWGTDVSQATIAADSLSVTSQSDCTISDVRDNGKGGVSFTRLDTRLPWAIDETWNGTGRAEAVDLVPAIENWQDYSLTVTGLADGTYDVFINGVDVGDVTDDQLAAGWNMSDLTVGPVWEKGQEVLGRVRDLQGISRTDLTEVTSPSRYGVEKYKSSADLEYQTNGLRGATLIAALADEIAEIDAYEVAIQEAAQPEPLSFSIQLQGATYTPPTGIPDPDWGTTHPITASIPAQPGNWPSAEAAGYYYVDNTHPSATDTGNTYGYPDQPRLTIPEISYPAGSYVEIHGGPYRWSAGDAEFDFDAAGTDESPVWVVGTGEVQGVWEINGQYAIIDGLTFAYDTVNGKDPGMGFGGDVDGDCDHICVRNVSVIGDGTYHAGNGSALALAGSSGDEVNNIVFFNVDVRDLNDVDYAINTAEDDNHAFLPGLYVNNVWFLDCVATACSGDGMQVSGNNATGEARAQYIYVGDCAFYGNGENAVDIKSSLDVILSSNSFHTFQKSGGSDGTAVVIQQEGGDGSDNVWVIFNEIYNCVVGVRSEEVVTNIYAIGNLIRDTIAYPTNADYGWAAYTRTAGATLHIIDNTFTNLDRSAVGWDGTSGTAPTLSIHGNIFSGKDDTAAWWIEGDATTVSGSSDYNLFDSTDQFRVTWEGATYTDLASYQSGESQDANSASGLPSFTGASDFSPSGTSDALGLSVEASAYSTFSTRYGLSIKYDIAGNARPASGAWTAGAYQVGSGGGGNGNMNAATLSVGTLTIGE